MEENEPVQATAESPTLNTRYFFKLGSNIVSIFAGIITAAIIPRALGVRAYGDFSFVNNVVTQLLTFLDLRSSTCFYVRLSQRQKERDLVTFYGYYAVLIFVILAILLASLTMPFRGYSLFEHIPHRLIVYAFLFVGIKWLVDLFIKISDAYAATVEVERIKMGNTLLSCVIVIGLFYFDQTTIEVFYIQQIALFTLLLVLIYYHLKSRNINITIVRLLSWNDVRKYLSEFYLYSSPLALYLIITLLTELFDRFVLQHFGGSFEQGIYSFSYSIANMTILFVTAMVPLFTRELSIAFSTSDSNLTGKLYRRYVPTIYIISAYFCCFLFVNVENVALILGGEQFVDSLMSLRIMMLYPLVATYSNLNGAVIFASGRTRLFKNLAIGLAPIGMLTTYLLISDSGLFLGSSGLAIKVVALEFISVCFVMWSISSYMNIVLWKYLAHMLVSPLILIAVGYAVLTGLSFIEVLRDYRVVSFVISGVVYSILIFGLTYWFPRLAGISVESKMNLVRKLTGWLDRKSV
ncbi:MAG TPA: lipopolysaccharide biosynthesis protein [Cyclobacteriaceae bacterium]|nr:lipopolysaccharide biosynthesis protein [Cyclobacteriaceae bacterium]